MLRLVMKERAAETGKSKMAIGKRIFGLCMMITLLACVLCGPAELSAHGAGVQRLLSVYDGARLSSSSGNAVQWRGMVQSFLFADFGTVGQAHLMASNAPEIHNMLYYTPLSEVFTQLLRQSDGVELLVHLSSDSTPSQILVGIGDYIASATPEKGQVIKLRLPFDSFSNGGASLSVGKQYMTGGMISIGVKGGGRIDCIFSDLYAYTGDAQLQAAASTSRDIGGKDGRLLHFASLSDVEYVQSGTTVPVVRLSDVFAPSSGIRCSVSGQPDWTSDLSFYKFLPAGTLAKYSGLQFYAAGYTSGQVAQYFALKIYANVTAYDANGKKYQKRATFVRTVSLQEQGRSQMEKLSFDSFTCDTMDQQGNAYKLTGDVLQAADTIVIQTGVYRGTDDQPFYGDYYFSDMFGYTASAEYLPDLGASGTVEQSATEELDAQIQQLLDLYSQLPGTDPDQYIYVDYQNLQTFLESYAVLTQEQKERLAAAGIGPEQYQALLELYQEMDPPDPDKTRPYKLWASQQVAQQDAPGVVTVKSLMFLLFFILSASVFAYTCMAAWMDRMQRKKGMDI